MKNDFIKLRRQTEKLDANDMSHTTISGQFSNMTCHL